MPAGIDRGVAQWAFDHGEPAGYGTDTLPASPVLYAAEAPVRHRDFFPRERNSNNVFTPYCSRSKTKTLTLDL